MLVITRSLRTAFNLNCGYRGFSPGTKTTQRKSTMRNRIAVWGRDAQENRILITIELQVKDNIVRIQTYPEKVVTDDVYKKFMDQWRKSQEVELPEPDRVVARELSVTEGLLPEDLKAEQTDMIIRAQTEWHFHVLSAKLAETYKAELAEIEDRVERASEYSSDLWNQAKQFWQKVQGQVQDKTLLREQGNDIRKRVDKTFDELKKMRDKLNEQYKEESTKQVAKFSGMLEKAEADIEQGTHLNKVFNQLRDIQRKFHNVKFTKDDRDKIYKRIDKAFKDVKEKRGGGSESNGGGAAGRISSRLDGLLKAMERMTKSINRDKEDLKFEHRRIERTDGQLEKQIRQAKVIMIESRVTSKQAKLDDMEKTKAQLERKIEQEKKRAEKRAKKDAERAAATAAKAKIAAQIGGRQVSPEEAAKLEAAAAAIQAGKKKGGRTKASERLPRRVANFVAFSEIITPGVDKSSAGAPIAGKATSAPVAEHNAVTMPEGPAISTAQDGDGTTVEPSIADRAGDTITGAIYAAGDAIAPLREKDGLVDQVTEVYESAKETISEVIEDVSDNARAVAQVAGERLTQKGEEE